MNATMGATTAGAVRVVDCHTLSLAQSEGHVSARRHASHNAGVAGSSPAPATPKALARNGLAPSCVCAPELRDHGCDQRTSILRIAGNPNRAGRPLSLAGAPHSAGAS